MTTKFNLKIKNNTNPEMMVEQHPEIRKKTIQNDRETARTSKSEKQIDLDDNRNDNKMEGCIHLDSYKRYKKKITKFIAQMHKVKCQICKSSFQVHACVTCGYFICFDHLNEHFEKNVTNKIEQPSKTVDHIKKSLISNDISEKSEIVNSFLNNNYELSKKDVKKGFSHGNTMGFSNVTSFDFDRQIKADNTKRQTKTFLELDEFDDHSLPQTASQSFFDLETYIQDDTKQIETINDNNEQKLINNNRNTCTGFFFNTEKLQIFCYFCKKYLKFTKLRDQILQRRFQVKNQRNFNRLQHSYIKGIQNMGNSCYMNVVLQIFLNSSIFRSKILDGTHEKITCQDIFCLICSLKSLFIDSFSSNFTYTPTDLIFSFFYKMKPKYNSEEFDSHEFFLDLCDVIHDCTKKTENNSESKSKSNFEIKSKSNSEKNSKSKPENNSESKSKSKSENNSESKPENNSESKSKSKSENKSDNKSESDCQCIIHSIFGGKTESVLECQSCKAQSIRQENFNSLSLCPKSNIQDSFTSYFQNEVLDGFYCQNCNQKDSGIRRWQLAHFPKLLCLHIKRYVNNGIKVTKNLDNIELTKILSLENVSSENKFYKLYAVICHSGEIKSGHYFIYLLKNNFWLKFDDENVTISSFKSIPRDISYILFYELEE
ncbi:Ubiquitin-specific protease [Pseudoloma neurophilia]|uniref:Ubiquitin carboxyl-terminal hydrolase n=1 Tax=Pseudoloma neurophilia TaxID=146866 RepID=A0A0R0M0P6_9MICR|nr:Ubiquitin-specific protease [Pseudoloma neurophilia]